MTEKFTFTNSEVVGLSHEALKKLEQMPETVNAFFKGVVSNKDMGKLVENVINEAKLGEFSPPAAGIQSTHERVV